MIATFRETAASLQNLKYGNQIIKKTWGQTLWYWSQYLILFLIVACVLGLAALVYYTPQLAKLASDNLPDIAITVKDGKASTNVPQPFVRGDANFSFIIDTKGTAVELDKFKQGVLLTSTQLITKTDKEIKIMNLKDVQNFSGSKKDIVNWLRTHQANILIFGLVLLILLAGLGIGFYWAWNVVVMLLWTLVILLVLTVVKKKMQFADLFKIVAYASVPVLLVHFVGFFFPSQLFDLVGLVVFLFYTISWIRNLHLNKK